MESRLERYRNRRRQNYIKLFKLIILLCLGILLVLFMFRVNQTIIELKVLDNTELLSFDISKKSFSLLGKTYIINIR